MRNIATKFGRPGRCFLTAFLLLVVTGSVSGQLKWDCVDSAFQPLPASVHIYRTRQPVDTGTFQAYYLEARLSDQHLLFTADTTDGRRMTPSGFYAKNGRPLAVVNCTFFSFETNRSLDLVVKNGKLVSHNWKPSRGREADSIRYFHMNTAAIGIFPDRQADVAWVVADSIHKQVRAFQASPLEKDSTVVWRKRGKNWPVETAVGGGPALIYDGKVRITNNEERMFAGKAIWDKHPRTAMGYTRDGRLIILVIQGRSPESRGATLEQEAQILRDLDCVEALNLDGGGSSCLLVNGKQTIKPSDKQGQRPVPAVFLIMVKD